MSDDTERPTNLGFFASQEMAERLREVAKQQDRSVSAVIRKAIEAELRREESEEVTAS